MNTNLGPIINTIVCLTMAFEMSTLSTKLMDVNIFKISFEQKPSSDIKTCDCVIVNQKYLEGNTQKISNEIWIFINNIICHLAEYLYLSATDDIIYVSKY